MSSTIIQAAIFAAGAVVGGGVAAAITSRKQSHAVPVPSHNMPAVSHVPPVIDMGPKGGAQITSIATTGTFTDLPVLKYGNPGAYS